ncbi:MULTISPECIES: glycosyltransferase family 2 protein [unclassified Rhizobium]|uniref:glycosyltransferase family 2 protein n=1 Tax=unclassified Rhizobium TaxID=2613769 RepID=UPI000EA8A556|nr:MULTISPECIES: glycosyltransferase family 2 protein [unclassified Rhizobium]AYG70165.1 glycosyltransferase family 2 protein [Rhizobium sp. CCGE531]AYG76540.1 glycosyltransferase family 2 protein [Rhizobium sp. CCGE532]
MLTFSIVIPVYNRAHLIAYALDSLKRQSFRDFECLIIDDGSTDGEQLRTLVENRYDERFRYFRFNNAGASIARNRGIELAVGRYIAFLDSDDQFFPSKLELVAERLESQPADIYFAKAQAVRGDGAAAIRPSRAPAAGERLDEYLFCALEPIQTSTIVLRADIARQHPFVPGLKKYEEAIFLLRLINQGCSIDFIPETLTIWNDDVPAGRLGHRRELDNMKEWYSNERNLLSNRAQQGFRANVLSYEYGWSNPFRTVGYILEACVRGGTSPKRGVHSLVRALLPQRFYRPLVNTILRLFFRRVQSST